MEESRYGVAGPVPSSGGLIEKGSAEEVALA